MTSQQDFLKGGTSYPAIKPETIGEVITGTIAGTPEPIQRPALNPPHELEWQLPINLKVNDEDRTLWVPKSQLSSAIGEACRKAGVDGVADGGILKVKLIEQRPTKFPKPQNIYAAAYTPPAAPTVAMSDVFGDDASAGGEEPF